MCRRLSVNGCESRNSALMLRRSDTQSELLLRIEDAPFHGTDRDAFRGRDLVVFPLLEEPKSHHFPFTLFEQGHELLETNAGAAGQSRAGNVIHDGIEIHVIRLAR